MKIARDVWQDGSSYPRQEAEVETKGRRRPRPKAENRGSRTQRAARVRPGSRLWSWTQPGPKGSEDRPSNGGFARNCPGQNPKETLPRQGFFCFEFQIKITYRSTFYRSIIFTILIQCVSGLEFCSGTQFVPYPHKV